MSGRVLEYLMRVMSSDLANGEIVYWDLRGLYCVWDLLLLLRSLGPLVCRISGILHCRSHCISRAAT